MIRDELKDFLGTLRGLSYLPPKQQVLRLANSHRSFCELAVNYYGII